MVSVLLERFCMESLYSISQEAAIDKKQKRGKMVVTVVSKELLL